MSACAQFYVKILNKYEWKSIVIIIDIDSAPVYFQLASMVIDNCQRTGRHPVVKKISTKMGISFPTVLGHFRKISRGRIVNCMKLQEKSVLTDDQKSARHKQ